MKLHLLTVNGDKRLFNILSLLIVIAFTDMGSCCEQNLTPLADGCVCPGNSLQFTCTVAGIGTTVWTIGQQCTIGLEHSRFATDVTRSCGAPSVIGRSLSAVGDCYMSQLTVMVTSDLNGMSVGCEYDNGTSIEYIGSYQIILTSEPFPPPDDVHLINITSEGLTFSWSPVASSCSAIFYNIFASDDCGECPVNTTFTNTTCLAVHLTPDALCDFSIQTSVCEIAGDRSDSVFITLPSVLRAAPVVKIFPKYHQTTTSLLSFMTVIDKIAPVSISGINVTIQFFTIKYSISGLVCDSEKIDLSDQACVEDVCVTEYDVTSDMSGCIINTASDINVAVTATSDLGTGQEYQSTVAGTYVNFVNVSHGTNIIICTFSQQDTNKKSCNATYGQCGQQQSQFAYSVGSETQLVLELQLSDPANYCYTVTASNKTVTVFIEGSIIGPQNTRLEPGAIAGIVIGSLAAVVITLAATVIILRYIYQKKTGTEATVHLPQTGGQQLEERRNELKPTAINPQEEHDHEAKSKENKNIRPQPDQKHKDTRPITVDHQEGHHDKLKPEENDRSQHDQETKDTHPTTGSQLKESHDEANSEEKQSQEHKNTQPTTVDHLEEHHDGPNSEENTIQHTSQPDHESSNNTRNQIEDDSEIFANLEQVDKNSYRLHKVQEDCGLLKFFKKHSIEFCRGCAFFEFQNEHEDIHRNSRIILIDKITDKYYSGEAARKLVRLLPSPEESKESEIEVEIVKPDHLFENYRVFIQDRGPGTRYLPKESTLLIQEEGLEEVPSGRFLWFSVEEDCELLTFIESQLDPCQPDKKLVFHRGNAFYEFSHKSEDITGKKEVVVMDVKTEILYTGERAKIMLGIPGRGIRNPYKDKKKWRVFVQSSCTGNRHLDKGTIVLYENVKKSFMKSSPSTASIYMERVEDHYDVIDVAEDCSLRDFIEDIKDKEYERGCSYYELTAKEVDIDSGKEVMLMNKNGVLFAGQAAARKIGAPGINLKNPGLPEYSRAFICCNGPGHNIFIRKGTSVLYKDPKIPPDLTPVNLEDFYRFDVCQTCELRSFVEQELQNLHLNIAYKKGNAYFEFTCATEDIERKKKVLLMDEEGKLFTGPAARRMIGAPGIGIPKPGPDIGYTVFIQNQSRGSRCLIKGSVLYYKKD